MYALLPILAFLATANAAPVAVNNNVEVVDKRACLDPLGILCFGGGAAAPSSSSSSAKASSTSSSASASASKSSASSVAPTSTSTTPASSSSSASASKSAAASSSSSAGNVVQSVVAVPSQVVSAVIKCPLDPLGVLGLCVDANTGASSSAAVSASKSSASAQATTTSAPASSASASGSGNIVQSVVAVPSQVVSAVIKCPLDPLGVLGLCVDANTGASSSASVSKASASASSSSAAGAGNVISSIVAVPSAVVSTVQSVANPVVSSAASVIAPVASAASSVVAPVASAASSVIAPVASAASSVVAPVASAASSVVAPVASAASSVVAPVASAASSVVAPVASAASSVVAPVASAASSVVAPIVSVIVPSPAASSVSSIIASVSASSAAPPSSSSAVVVTPTSTASSSSAAPSASAAPGNANVANWAYTACVQEGTNGRALTGSMFGGSGMTVESCLASCDASGFLYAGLEYGQECWCGSSLANGASLSKTGTCDMPCAGNGKELCGGSSTLSLYTSTKAQSQAPALPAGWSSTTCMQEVSGRAFTKSSFASDDMTVNKCISFCGNSKYAAVEYGRECYCGDDVSNGASLTSTSGQCNVPCAGLASQTCGGPNALQVYTNAGYKTASSGAYTNTGCWQEVDGRLLRGASIASDSMTIDTCTSFCQSQGFKIAGLEYGKECYCDNSPVSSPLTSGQCNMACAGNAGQNCGGPNALNVFQLGA